jgi:hypothetical protein
MRSIKLVAVLVAAAALALAPSALAAHRHRALKRPSAAGCRVSLFAEPHVVTSGETVQLFGLLRCPTEPVAGQTVTIFERTGGQPTATVVGTATTVAGGLYATVSPAITQDSKFFVRVAGARSGTRAVKVAPQVTVLGPAPDGAQLRTGRRNRVAFQGAVSPADGGAELFLQRESSTSTEDWHTIQRGFVRSDGSYLIVHTFTIPGDANLRVVVRPHGKFSMRGISNTLSYEISQAQNPRLTINSSSDPAAFGAPVTISGVLAGGANQKVTLLSHPKEIAPFKKADETTTDGSGAYTFTIPSAAINTAYRVTGGGIKSAVLFQGVRYVLTAGVSATTVQAGQPLVFSGTVAPIHPGKVVYLERQNAFGTGFHVVGVTTLTAGGTYSITRFPFGSGKQVYRIKVPGDPANMAASSSPFTVEVTPAPPSLLRPRAQNSLPH